MKYGISGETIPPKLTFAGSVGNASDYLNFWPLIAYCIAYRETIREYGVNSPTKTSDNGDGGYGLCQITSPFQDQWPPANWQDPYRNTVYAIRYYLISAFDFWYHAGFQGDQLIKLGCATYNEGLGNAIAAHAKGNVDLYDTNNYGADCLSYYHNLLSKGTPE